MKINIMLVRHGKTEGNTQGRYVGGRINEALCGEGLAELELKKEHILSKWKEKSFLLFSSPMIRCISTAEVLFPDKTPIIVDKLREINFGSFEGKNYRELNGSKEYQDYINSGGKLDFPGGESIEAFADRSVSAFWYIIDMLLKASEDSAAIVCHGGSIMAVMSCLTGDDYFKFQVKNAEGYLVTLDINGKDIAEVSYSCI